MKQKRFVFFSPQLIFLKLHHWFRLNRNADASPHPKLTASEPLGAWQFHSQEPFILKDDKTIKALLTQMWILIIESKKKKKSIASIIQLEYFL